MASSEAREAGGLTLALAPVKCHATLFVVSLLWLISSLYCVLHEVRNSPLTSPPLCPSGSRLVPEDWVSGQLVGAGEQVPCQDGGGNAPEEVFAENLLSGPVPYLAPWGAPRGRIRG